MRLYIIKQRTVLYWIKLKD